jgi:predicted aspartyl protease
MTLILRPRGRLMGQVTTWITVGSIFEAGREMQCKALVDTGAYCLTLPAAWRDRFGTLPMSEIVEVEMADGRVETLEGARVAVDMVAHRLRRIPRVDLNRARRAA